MSRTGAAIECPKCGASDSRVVESRGRRGYIYRVRECRSCYARVATREEMTHTVESLPYHYQAALRKRLSEVLGA